MESFKYGSVDKYHWLDIHTSINNRKYEKMKQRSKNSARLKQKIVTMYIVEQLLLIY